MHPIILMGSVVRPPLVHSPWEGTCGTGCAWLVWGRMVHRKEKNRGSRRCLEWKGADLILVDHRDCIKIAFLKSKKKWIFFWVELSIPQTVPFVICWGEVRGPLSPGQDTVPVILQRLAPERFRVWSRAPGDMRMPSSPDFPFGVPLLPPKANSRLEWLWERHGLQWSC